MLFFLRQSSSEDFLAGFLKSIWLSNISEIHRQAENSLESTYRRRPISLNSITSALYTIHQRQRCTGCSFQLLFPQIPTEISFVRTMHFFTSEKERKKINIWFQYMWKPIDTVPRPSFSLLFLPLFPSSLANGKQKQWWMVIGRSGCRRSSEWGSWWERLSRNHTGVDAVNPPADKRAAKRRKGRNVHINSSVEEKNTSPSRSLPPEGASAALLSLWLLSCQLGNNTYESSICIHVLCISFPGEFWDFTRAKGHEWRQANYKNNHFLTGSDKKKWL